MELLPSFNTGNESDIESCYNALNTIIQKIGFDQFRDIFMKYIKIEDMDLTDDQKEGLTSMLNTGIVIKIIHMDILQFYYLEKPGAGIGFMDWSIVKNPGWYNLFRQGGVYRNNDQTHLFYGLKKSLLTSQYRNRKPIITDKPCTIQTKTDGSALTAISYYRYNKRLTCWSTNKNSGVDPHIEEELENACTNSDQMILDIIEILEISEHSFISLQIEFVGNNLLASYHPINCIWFNQIQFSEDDCQNIVTLTYEQLENLRQNLENKGYRCPQRFHIDVDLPDDVNIVKFCNQFVQYAVNMEIDQIQKYGTVGDYSSNLRARVLSTFEGFVLNYHIANIPDFKIKYPMFKLVNKLSFGRTPEFREKLLVALFEINLKMHGQIDDDFSTICAKYDEQLAIILSMAERHNIVWNKNDITQLFKNIVTDLNSYDINRFKDDVNLSCLLEQDKTGEKYKLVQGRTLYTTPGLKELYDENVTAEVFRLFWKKYVQSNNRKSSKNLRLFRGAFKSNSALRFILSLPRNITSDAIFEGSTVQGQVQKLQRQRERQEDYSVPDSCMLEFEQTIKMILDYGTTTKWLIVDMDNTLLYLPEDASLIGQYNNVPSRMCTHLNIDFCNYIASFVAKHNLKILILTGAKIGRDDVRNILSNVPFEISAIQPGYFGTMTAIFKRCFLNELEKMNIRTVAFIDDDEKIFQNAKHMIPTFKIQNGIFGKPPGYLPTMVGFLGCPGMGKSTLCTRVLKYLQNTRHFNLDMARLAGKAEGCAEGLAGDLISYAKTILKTSAPNHSTILYDQMGLNIRDVQQLRAQDRSICFILVPREFFNGLEQTVYDAVKCKNIIEDLATYFSNKNNKEQIMQILKDRVISRSSDSGNCFESTFHAAQVEKGILLDKYNAMIKCLKNPDISKTYTAFAFFPMDSTDAEVKDLLIPIHAKILEIDTTVPFYQYANIYFPNFEKYNDLTISDAHLTLSFGFDHKYATLLLEYLASHTDRIKVSVSELVTTEYKGKKYIWLNCKLPEEIQYLFQNGNDRPHITLKAPERMAKMCGILDYNSVDSIKLDSEFVLEGTVRIF